jgi:hypothetical protein
LIGVRRSLSAIEAISSSPELAIFQTSWKASSSLRRDARPFKSQKTTVLSHLREESLSVVFFDIGAVVNFLRKVIWTVPDFTVEKYRDRLFALHVHIQRYGNFQSRSKRFLIDARKPK